jgi:CRP/FNR family transcriptional regulator, cyclic AMP receptor protein
VAGEQEPTASERVTLLKGVPLFQNLDDDDLAAVASQAQIRSYPAGKVICEQGDEGDEMFLILSGTIAIDRSEPDSPARRLKEMGPGDYFGEMAVMGEGRRFASVTALADTRMLTLTRDAVMEAARSNRNLLLSLVQMQAQRLGEIAATLTKRKSSL